MRVLDAAERLFAQKGYQSVTLRDIALDVGIRHTSLYHHAPGGKEQLFIEVTERNLNHHYNGLKRAIANAELNLRDQIRSIAGWLLSQPPMDLIRMVYSDMPVIDQTEAARLSLLAYQSMLRPIQEVLEQARERGEIDYPDLPLISGGILGLIESLHAVPQNVLTKSRPVMAFELIDVLLNGLYSGRGN